MIERKAAGQAFQVSTAKRHSGRSPKGHAARSRGVKRLGGSAEDACAASRGDEISCQGSDLVQERRSVSSQRRPQLRPAADPIASGVRGPRAQSELRTSCVFERCRRDCAVDLRQRIVASPVNMFVWVQCVVA
ncbi:hypothetical protein GWI33_006148 [Rhynchophorus ferrugineus]|uniref:Uncharacterized protein n=1 Tax=Rhynchophorus ferrugineus TaxID=354439 RepID=A0A834ME03_RHYFE|nr:hypothetical protein GWI33_006148 [Rhynchophorus ferrugineus]